MEPTREQRLGNLRDDNYIKYVIENIPLKDFDYKYVCNFDEEVKLLQEYFESDKVELTRIDPNTPWARVIGEVDRLQIIVIRNFDLLVEPYSPHLKSYDVELLDLCNPIIKKIEEIYDGVALEVTIHKLKPGTRIPDHNDLDGYINGNNYNEYLYFKLIHKIHIVISTNDKVFFRIENNVKNLKTNECWEINDQLDHEVWNNGDTERIHLIVNLVNDKWAIE